MSVHNESETIVPERLCLQHPDAKPSDELLAIKPHLLMLGFVFREYDVDWPDMSFLWRGYTLLVEHRGNATRGRRPWRIQETTRPSSNPADRTKEFWYKTPEEVLAHAQGWLNRMEALDEGQPHE